MALTAKDLEAIERDLALLKERVDLLEQMVAKLKAALGGQGVNVN